MLETDRYVYCRARVFVGKKEDGFKGAFRERINKLG